MAERNRDEALIFFHHPEKGKVTISPGELDETSPYYLDCALLAALSQEAPFQNAYVRAMDEVTARAARLAEGRAEDCLADIVELPEGYYLSRMAGCSTVQLFCPTPASEPYPLRSSEALTYLSVAQLAALHQKTGGLPQYEFAARDKCHDEVSVTSDLGDAVLSATFPYFVATLVFDSKRSIPVLRSRARPVGQLFMNKAGEAPVLLGDAGAALPCLIRTKTLRMDGGMSVVDSGDCGAYLEKTGKKLGVVLANEQMMGAMCKHLSDGYSGLPLAFLWALQGKGGAIPYRPSEAGTDESGLTEFDVRPMPAEGKPEIGVIYHQEFFGRSKQGDESCTILFFYQQKRKGKGARVKVELDTDAGEILLGGYSQGSEYTVELPGDFYVPQPSQARQDAFAEYTKIRSLLFMLFAMIQDEFPADYSDANAGACGYPRVEMRELLAQINGRYTQLDRKKQTDVAAGEELAHYAEAATDLVGRACRTVRVLLDRHAAAADAQQRPAGLYRSLLMGYAGAIGDAKLTAAITRGAASLVAVAVPASQVGVLAQGPALPAAGGVPAHDAVANCSQ
jgi:hypothetical protein